MPLNFNPTPPKPKIPPKITCVSAEYVVYYKQRNCSYILSAPLAHNSRSRSCFSNLRSLFLVTGLSHTSFSRAENGCQMWPTPHCVRHLCHRLLRAGSMLFTLPPGLDNVIPGGFICAAHAASTGTRRHIGIRRGGQTTEGLYSHSCLSHPPPPLRLQWPAEILRT